MSDQSSAPVGASAPGTTSSAPVTRVRKSVRVHPDTAMQMDYWSRKHNLVENEYIIEAIEEKIARENGDYDLPTLEIKRLNQIIDELKALSTNQANLETVIVTGFDSLIGLTRGDSYLLDDDDGELLIGNGADGVAGSGD